MHRPEKLDGLQLRMEAFQVDRGWYERHWMQERPRRSWGVIARVLPACLAALRNVALAGRTPWGQAVAAASDDARATTTGA